jgi:hypothetical protein
MPDGVSRDRIFGSKKEAESAGGVPAAATPAQEVKMSVSGKLEERGVHDSRAFARRAGVSATPESASRGLTAAGIPQKTKQLAAQESEQDASEPRSRMAPELSELVKLMKGKGTKDFKHGALSVEQGRVLVQVWLESTSEASLKKLETMGFKISFKATGGKMVIGSIEVEKLEELAKLPEVKLIEPVKA